MTTITMTNLSSNPTDSIWYLKKPEGSIFLGQEFREYPSFPLLYGFLHNKMGIKLRKWMAKTYPDEQTHYKNFCKNIKYDGNTPYVSVQYRLPSHGWGRIVSVGNSDMSVFHRPSRHAFAQENYLDYDIRNAHLQLIFCKASTAKIETPGLAEYCADPKQVRQDIVAHYKLKDIKYPDGFILTAIDQAKKLPIRLAYGGSLYEWKKEYNVERCPDMDIVIQLENTLNKISDEIYKVSQHIRSDLEASSPEWCLKSDAKKKKSVMSFYAQTWERIIQEECISHLVRRYPQAKLRDIIPSQDGFMPLQVHVKGIDREQLFQEFNSIIQAKYDMNILWEMKPFNEAIPITPCDILPLYISLDDLEKGERRIAEVVAPSLKPVLKYYEAGKSHEWFRLNERNLWISSPAPPLYDIVKMVQNCIEDERIALNASRSKETDEKKIKDINQKDLLLARHYKNVGGPSFSKHLACYLQTLLLDNDFPKLLNNTAGLFIFNDGILNLKATVFQRGFKSTDYITADSLCSQNYLDLKTDPIKAEFLRLQLKKILNYNDEHLEYFLSIIGHTMTGDASLEKVFYYLKDGTDCSKGNNGKTTLFYLLERVFPHLIYMASPTVLEKNNTKAHKEIARFKGKRIVYCDEGTKKCMNDALVKKLGDGIAIPNEVMYGTTEDIPVSFKMFICSNHVPKFSEDNEAVFNRYRQVEMCSHFDKDRTEDCIERLEFIGNASLKNTLTTEYVDEIIDLILRYAIRYYVSGIPSIPIAFRDASMETKTANNDFAVWFNTVFERGDYNISMDDVMMTPYLQMDIKTMKKEIKRNMGFEFNKDITGFGKTIKEGKEVYIKGGFAGFRRVVSESVCEVVIEEV